MLADIAPLTMRLAIFFFLGMCWTGLGVVVAYVLKAIIIDAIIELRNDAEERAMSFDEEEGEQ